jgi:hypothetical protein
MWIEAGGLERKGMAMTMWIDRKEMAKKRMGCEGNGQSVLHRKVEAPETCCYRPASVTTLQLPAFFILSLVANTPR